MEYRKLGTTDLEVSAICLGTMTFGEQNSEQEGHEQMDYALDHGVNFLDTAELYAIPRNKDTQGLTEEYIGTWLNARKNREKVIIGTKATGPAPGLEHISDNLGFSKDRLNDAVDNSLRRLQTDYIDLYQLHWPERRTNCFGDRGYLWGKDNRWKDNIRESLETLRQLKQDGKIRHWGISNETPWGVMRYFNECDDMDFERPASIQNCYNLLNRLFEVGLSEISAKEDMGLLAYSPVSFGLLTGKYHKKTDTPANRLNKFKVMARYNNENCYNATTKYIEIAESHGISPAQMSIAFITQMPFVTSTIIGATSISQLKENIDSVNLKLDKEVIQKINAVHEQIPNPAP